MEGPGLFRSLAMGSSMAHGCTCAASTGHPLSRPELEVCTFLSPRLFVWLQHFLKSVVRKSPASASHSSSFGVGARLRPRRPSLRRSSLSTRSFRIFATSAPFCLLPSHRIFAGGGSSTSSFHRRFGFVGWNSRRVRTVESHVDAPGVAKGWRRRRRKRGKTNVRVPASLAACETEEKRSVARGTGADGHGSGTDGNRAGRIGAGETNEKKKRRKKPGGAADPRRSTAPCPRASVRFPTCFVRGSRWKIWQKRKKAPVLQVTSNAAMGVERRGNNPSSCLEDDTS